jgi:hypothetical protein
MKIRTVGAKLLHAERQTDRHDKVNITSRNFAKALKNYKKSCILFKCLLYVTFRL